ncbi:MAG: hypothetical protein EP343_04680 [Deltaproteobacteria bacterium]|nr:MAG: hypothetical protein EP343_04680 [Deltaproteobacteria bacterium]
MRPPEIDQVVGNVKPGISIPGHRQHQSQVIVNINPKPLRHPPQVIDTINPELTLPSIPYQ